MRDDGRDRRVTRRHLLKALGWAGAVFAIGFGSPRVDAEGWMDCHNLNPPGADPDPDCGQGSGPSYDIDGYCAVQANGQQQSDIGCGRGTGKPGNESIDEDDNCNLGAAGTTGTEVDFDCGRQPVGPQMPTDGNCGQAEAFTLQTDSDGRCGQSSSEETNWSDASCHQKHDGDTYHAQDGNCGQPTATGWDVDGNCAVQLSGGSNPEYDTDANCSHVVEGVEDDDGSCGKHRTGGIDDEDQTCNHVIGGVLQEDLSCGKWKSENAKDPDETCGQAIGNPPAIDKDNNCGDLTNDPLHVDPDPSCHQPFGAAFHEDGDCDKQGQADPLPAIDANCGSPRNLPGGLIGTDPDP